MSNINRLVTTMIDTLESLFEDPKTDSELLDKIPNFSLELLGKLRTLDAIEHHGNLVYITSRGEKLLKEMRQKPQK